MPQTTASAPIACRVSAVFVSDSPLDTDEPLAEKLITSADSRLAASSNEMRVRVESSKNRLTTVRRRSVGSLRTSRPPIACSIRAAVSRTCSAASRSSRRAAGAGVAGWHVRGAGRGESRRRGDAVVELCGCVVRRRGTGRCRHQALTNATESTPSISSSRTTTSSANAGSGLADVVGADRQLPVAPVDQHRQLHDAGPAMVAERVQRRAHGPARNTGRRLPGRRWHRRSRRRATWSPAAPAAADGAGRPGTG